MKCYYLVRLRCRAHFFKLITLTVGKITLPLAYLDSYFVILPRTINEIASNSYYTIIRATLLIAHPLPPSHHSQVLPYQQICPRCALPVSEFDVGRIASAVNRRDRYIRKGVLESTKSERRRIVQWFSAGNVVRIWKISSGDVDAGARPRAYQCNKLRSMRAGS